MIKLINKLKKYFNLLINYCCFDFYNKNIEINKIININFYFFNELCPEFKINIINPL